MIEQAKLRYVTRA